MMDQTERFAASPDGIEVHTNEALECKDCAFRRRVVGDCEKFPTRKPGYVLRGEKPCPEYQHE